jgi:atypical dual specificity phosphatase
VKEADAVLSMLNELKKTRALIMITHNQTAGRALFDDVVLLAGGTLAETSAAPEFFEEPTTALGRRFIKDGNCWPRADEIDPEWLAHSQKPNRDDAIPEDPPTSAPKPSWIPTAKECAVRPGGFHWIEPSRLGGMQWPGLLKEESTDLDGLVSLEVRHLVSLTEQPFPEAKVIPRPLLIHHFPIVDMRAPNHRACLMLCAEVDTWLKRSEATVFHCRAGLGRTGTLLACMRIFHGRSAVGAVDDVRRVNSMYIQSEEQLAFVDTFADYVRKHQGVAQSDTPGDTLRGT